MAQRPLTLGTQAPFMGVRVPQDLLDALDAYAAEVDESRSGAVRSALEFYLAHKAPELLERQVA